MKARFGLRTAALRLFLGVCAVLAVSAGSVLANPFEDTIGILEEQTVFHWGRDCLVWVVHYPEELVEPWVAAEAGRAGLTDSEREAYKEGFVSELSIGEREPFLFTVYAFGLRPLSFSPVSEKVALVTSDGERVKPVRYDKALDQPISGIVQGLIFFPKQPNQEFAVAVQGMGVHDERLFSFRENSSSVETAFVETARTDSEMDAEKNGEEEVVVLELPPKSDAPAKAPAGAASAGSSRRQPPRRQPQAPQEPPKEIERPPVPSAPPSPVVAPAEPKDPEQSMAEFVEAMRSKERSAPSSKAQEPAAASASAESASADPELSENAYVSREKTVRDFLSLWLQNDSEAMYAMLSESSRKLFSKETFESNLRKASDFRAALRDGYTLEWLGTERARVVAVKRILLIRALVNRTFGVTREGAAWKIVW